ncbi:hypothetical protein [Anaerosporobacter sp.]|uniref:hypothetical protein n=1 Tax=Anaerosporobacter sp. TaxID=1872529 RepID=UPI00286EBD11|nr:hypothetical protein [Anaerosporobacter sp.]
MKRIVLLGMVLCMLVGNVGCSSTKKVNENLNRIEAEQGEDTAGQNIEQETSQENQEDQTTQENIENVPKEIAPINASDFAITDGENLVLLDSLYDDFETPEEEIEKGASVNNYVGEVYVGEYVYKTFYHNFKDFNIYTSNTNYTFRGVDFDTYYITQIDLRTDKYKTARGAYIGIDIKEVLELYGEGEIISDDYDEKACMRLMYQYENYLLSFVYNDKDVVFRIVLSVSPIEDDSEEKPSSDEIIEKVTEGIDIYDYIDCNEQEFLEETGLEIEKAPDGDEYDSYVGYNEMISVYFNKHKIIMMHLFGEIQGYNLFGINCGMTIDDALAVLKERGFEYSYDNEMECYEVVSKEDDSFILYISIEKDIVTNLFYSINDFPCN